MPIQSVYRFTVKEYHRMGETGLLPPDARVELLDGQILNMSPIGNSHGATVKRLIQLFKHLDQDRCLISVQDPLRLDDHSEPQPDFMLVRPSMDCYESGHPGPDDVFLLIEVADTTLNFDREEKLPRYGRAGVAEVWIINLIDQSIEVYREPHFTGYASATILKAGQTASPAAFPDVMIDVSSLVKR